jgi:hypothetical protein
MTARANSITLLLGAVGGLIGRLERNIKFLGVTLHRAGRAPEFQPHYAGRGVPFRELTKLLVVTSGPGFSMIDRSFSHSRPHKIRR